MLRVVVNGLNGFQRIFSLQSVLSVKSVDIFEEVVNGLNGFQRIFSLQSVLSVKSVDIFEEVVNGLNGFQRIRFFSIRFIR